MRLILLTAVCAFIVLANFTPFALSKSIFEETNEKQSPGTTDNEHSNFFNTLTPAEQLWLMKIAVLYSEDPAVEEPEVPSVEQPEDPKGPTKMKRKASTLNDDFLPFPEFDEPPIGVMSELLNGKIPQQFQRGFTNWIRKEHNVTTRHIAHFKTYGTFCPPQTRDCPDFGDIGNQCCPFG